jgi:hypothetical protein
MERRINKYPIYIISKGRAHNPKTANLFEKCNIDYRIAIEPQEENEYLDVLPEKRILILPFSNLGLGSFPARNFCWEHSKNLGFEYHWLFDDNIMSFYKWINFKRQRIDNIVDALIFVESFIDKHNIDIGGCERKTFSIDPPKYPFRINCHVYSAMLIKNSLPYRWRLKYNEDIDLCFQVLHNGGITANCIYYLAEKTSTGSKMKGGNQDELYKGNDPKKKLLKVKMLQKVWPDYVKTVIRFNRFHHYIDWKVFQKNINKEDFFK